MVMLFGDTWTPEQAVYLKINRPQEQIEEYKKKMIAYCQSIDQAGEALSDKKGGKDGKEDKEDKDDDEKEEDRGM